MRIGAPALLPRRTGSTGGLASQPSTQASSPPVSQPPSQANSQPPSLPPSQPPSAPMSPRVPTNWVDNTGSPPLPPPPDGGGASGAGVEGSKNIDVNAEI